MLYNKYKNRIELISELIFHFKRFIKIKNNYEEDLINKEKNILEKKFEKKLNFLKFNYLEKGIVRRDFEIPVITIPIMNKDSSYYMTHDLSSMDSTIYKVQEEKRRIKKLYFSYSNSDVPFEHVKKEIALLIATHLIENDFINTHFQDNDILFTINIFQ